MEIWRIYKEEFNNRVCSVITAFSYWRLSHVLVVYPIRSYDVIVDPCRQGTMLVHFVVMSSRYIIVGYRLCML